MSQDAASRNPLDSVPGALGIRPGEFQAVAWSFTYFFFILSSYYVLRPVRDAMAIVSGVLTIPVLFTATFIVMLLVTPVFGWIASRYPRKQFLPWVYYFFISNILIFYALFTYPNYAGIDHVWISRSFFVWLSIFNLFVVTVFWSFMADIWSKQQSRRLFGVIAAGGSIGAIAGPAVASLLVDEIGWRNMFPISALLLFAAASCIYQLRNWVRETESSAPDIDSDDAMGGDPLAGLKAVFAKKYFGNIAMMMILANIVGVVTYTFLAELVAQSYPDTDSHVKVFGAIDAWINTLSFLGQFLLVRHSVKKFGVGATLALLPVVSVIGYALIAINPIFGVMALLQIARRSLTFGFAKPASDMLYTVVTPEEKYKVKNFIDTAVYRTGDMIGAWSLFFLNVIGIGMSGIALICAPVCVLWAVVALKIGRQYDQQYEAPSTGEQK